MCPLRPSSVQVKTREGLRKHAEKLWRKGFVKELSFRT